MACQTINVKEEIFSFPNIIPAEFQQEIVNCLTGENNFPWYLIDRIGHKDYFNNTDSQVYLDKNISDYGGLYHMLYDEGVSRSEYCDFFMQILDSYCQIMNKSISKVHRARIRYTHPVPHHNFIKYAAPHIDFNSDVDFTTLIYYVDISDGDTILFDKKHIPGQEYNPILQEPLTQVYTHTPNRGEAIAFSGHRYHSGNYPIEHGRRIVINFDFIENDA